MSPGRPETALPASKLAFSRVLQAAPGRLHVAAHSHHPWPDTSFAAQQDAWLDAATLLDGKWTRVLGDVLPETQAWIARTLGLPDPATVAVAGNTHELFVRILSGLDPPVRILTTDGEFVSFERQVRRLAEDGWVTVHRVPTRPFATLADRLAAAASEGGFDLLFFSHVLFGSGVVVDGLERIVGAVTDDHAVVVVDGYHGFMAVPTDLSAIADRAFYLAGGYKYAMSGEGACFAHCPPGHVPRPRVTGWFAEFPDLEGATGGGSVDQAGAQPGEPTVRYAADGRRLLGATFDPTALYRFNAVQRWLSGAGWTVAAIHDHVEALQRRFLGALEAHGDDTLLPAPSLVAGPTGRTPHGHLLAFARPDAADVTTALAERDVVVDQRGHHVRVGFGLYHDEADVDDLLDRLGTEPC